MCITEGYILNLHELKVARHIGDGQSEGERFEDDTQQQLYSVSSAFAINEERVSEVCIRCYLGVQ